MSYPSPEWPLLPSLVKGVSEKTQNIPSTAFTEITLKILITTSHRAYPKKKNGSASNRTNHRVFFLTGHPDLLLHTSDTTIGKMQYLLNMNEAHTAFLLGMVARGGQSISFLRRKVLC